MRLRGLAMEIEIAGLVGFVSAATSIGALICEHQTDVLQGAYMEGRLRLQTSGLMRHPLPFLVDRLGRNMIRIASSA
jgi:hypothetical protein